ncbi:NADPH-dependent FMN reductase [Paenibacillus xylaniclasticus]|uniref:NADPH-dependent FMN reductase n=1 Tax=Paenibacillus xylaniclasticus TaxID=588083 RepID=UPI000FDC1E82|nr:MULTISPECIES: NADPH-dependent FMN reductase [Paenibacillus]GFN32298.1 FMN reductase [Paenibacillus curdlanolyticus]
MAKNIAFVNGSLRKGSFNQNIVEYVKSKLEAKGYSVTQLNFSNLPLFNQDIEFPAPESVAAIREELKKADALWIVTPEYNGSVPGPLKNMLDWISRPVEIGVFGAPDFVKGKLVAISGAAGSSKAAYVMEELKGLLGRMAMNPLEQLAGIALTMEAFQTGKFTLSDADKELLDTQIEKFLEALNS